MHPNDPKLRSFVEVDPSSHFAIQNLPYGVFTTPTATKRRVGVAIGDFVLDLSVLELERLIQPAASGTVFRSLRSTTSCRWAPKPGRGSERGSVSCSVTTIRSCVIVRR
jgi:hypothetical protein